MNEELLVREMISGDIEHFVSYWLTASDKFLHGMGVDITKRPTRNQLTTLVSHQLGIPMKDRTSYFLTWLFDGQPIGCSNVNQINYGKEAFMHLHLWQHEHRQKGIGTRFVKKSLPFYFENLDLQQLFCEPYSLNPAPNKTIENIGFKFIKQYRTIPGASNFEQLVNQWRLTRPEFEELNI